MPPWAFVQLSQALATPAPGANDEESKPLSPMMAPKTIGDPEGVAALPVGVEAALPVGAAVVALPLGAAVVALDELLCELDPQAARKPAAVKRDSPPIKKRFHCLEVCICSPLFLRWLRIPPKPQCGFGNLSVQAITGGLACAL
jgi:hypothetical protein